MSSVTDILLKRKLGVNMEWHEVKEYFGQKISFGISDRHLHLAPGRAAGRGRFRSKGRSSQTRVNFVPFWSVCRSSGKRGQA